MDDENHPFFICEMQLESKCYLELENIFNEVFYKETHIKISKLVIPLENLQLLCNKFIEWVEKEILFTLNLVNDHGRIIDISIKVSDQMITSVSKPLFEISYSNGVTKNYIFSFIIDQSCAKIFIENLKGAIRS